MNDTKIDPMVEKIETLEAELEKAMQEVQTAKEAQTRALADLHNFQRRESEAKATWSRDSVAQFLQKMIPSLLELNLGSENTSDETIKAVIEKFFTGLGTQGLEKIQPEAGAQIDPNQHDVLMAAEGEPGTIVTCLEPGWMYLDKVIVPAKVSGATQ